MQVGVLVLVFVFAALLVALLIVAGRRARPERIATAEDSPRTMVERRVLLNRTLLGSLSLFALAMGAGSVGFLWPTVRRGYGSKITAGRLDSVLYELKHAPRIYNIEGKFHLVHYTGTDPEYYARQGVLVNGLMAISQKCSHLGCRVPYCPTSDLFECPCHGARFNRAGEWVNGPAPAGLWHFALEIVKGEVIVDTSRRIAQAPAGFNTVVPEKTGAYCVPD